VPEGEAVTEHPCLRRRRGEPGVALFLLKDPKSGNQRGSSGVCPRMHDWFDRSCVREDGPSGTDGGDSWARVVEVFARNGLSVGAPVAVKVVDAVAQREVQWHCN